MDGDRIGASIPVYIGKIHAPSPRVRSTRPHLRGEKLSAVRAAYGDPDIGDSNGVSAPIPIHIGKIRAPGAGIWATGPHLGRKEASSIGTPDRDLIGVEGNGV